MHELSGARFLLLPTQTRHMLRLQRAAPRCRFLLCRGALQSAPPITTASTACMERKRGIRAARQAEACFHSELLARYCVSVVKFEVLAEGGLFVCHEVFFRLRRSWLHCCTPTLCNHQSRSHLPARRGCHGSRAESICIKGSKRSRGC